MIEPNTIYHESAPSFLKRVPDNFIDCVVTSPPYYGKRSYGTPPQIWDAKDGCDHNWGEMIRHPNYDSRSPEEKRRQGGGVGNNLKTQDNAPRCGGQFCLECDAWLGELGQEPNVLMFIDHLIVIFKEIHRCLKATGTVWVNLDDSYNSGGNIRSGPDQVGSRFHTTVNRSKVGYVKISTAGQPVKRKSMFNVPGRFNIRMTDELGFIQRNLCIWQKDSVAPESMDDRLTHEYESLTFFSKEETYYFEQQFEPYRGKHQPRSEKVLEHHGQLAVPYNRAGDGDPRGRNMRDVLRINTEPSQQEHYAAYPKRLIEMPIKAGCPEGGLVYDPFTGSGTTPLTAMRLDRQYLGSELQEKYWIMATDRLKIESEKGKLF